MFLPPRCRAQESPLPFHFRATGYQVQVLPVWTDSCGMPSRFLWTVNWRSTKSSGESSSDFAVIHHSRLTITGSLRLTVLVPRFATRNQSGDLLRDDSHHDMIARHRRVPTRQIKFAFSSSRSVNLYRSCEFWDDIRNSQFLRYQITTMFMRTEWQKVMPTSEHYQQERIKALFEWWWKL